jgi:hypothetical protein
MSRAAHQRAKLDAELAAVDAALDRLRPMIDAIVDEVRVKLERIVVAALAGQTRAGKLGERKRCRVCGLPGARNMAALAPGHSRDEHERLRIKPLSVQPLARASFDAPRSTTPRRLQRA